MQLHKSGCDIKMRKFTLVFLLFFIINVIQGCKINENKKSLIILWKDNEINQLINEVSKDSLKIRIKALQDFNTRYPHEKQVAVANYIYNSLKAQNFDVRYQKYNWKDKAYKNVEVVLPGNKIPENYFVIGAHYDSKSNIPEKSAPGADDNASGVAALLELTRIIKNYDMANTIRIVFFSNEEQGLYGSANYVKYLKELPGHYLGGIIVDMIGYCDANRNLDIATIPEYEWLAVTAKEILQVYNISSFNLRIDKHCT